MRASVLGAGYIYASGRGDAPIGSFHIDVAPEISTSPPAGEFHAAWPGFEVRSHSFLPTPHWALRLSDATGATAGGEFSAWARSEINGRAGYLARIDVVDRSQFPPYGPDLFAVRLFDAAGRFIGGQTAIVRPGGAISIFLYQDALGAAKKWLADGEKSGLMWWGWNGAKIKKAVTDAQKALEERLRKARESWSDDMKKAYSEVEKKEALEAKEKALKDNPNDEKAKKEYENAKQEYEKAKAEAKDVPGSTKEAAEQVKKTENEAQKAKGDAEKAFAEGEANSDAGKLQDGAKKAQQAIQKAEEAIQKAESAPKKP